jgi:hypothetical protein
MQAFLKKVFRKDIIAIIQNLMRLTQDFWRYRIIPTVIPVTDRFTNWLDTCKTWLQNQRKKTYTKLEIFLFGDFLHTPIIIYQPGKVGSITVHRSLKVIFEKLNLDTPIHHAHNLNQIESVKKSVEQNRKAPAASLKKLAESEKLRAEIDSNPHQRWNIISLVRDPVALRVSTIFQVLEEYIPDWAELEREEKLSIADLQQLLITRQEFDPIHLSGWFNNQVQPLFGFDVFSSPFDTQAGYKIYRQPFKRFSFMIIRLEDLDRVAPEAFRKFLLLDQFQVINQNIGNDKPYSELYKKFKSTPLPAEYLDAAYSTPYARHFYTAAELETFRQRWLHPEIKKER